MNESEALELATRFLKAEHDCQVVMRLAERLDYATSKLFKRLPDRLRRRGHCWLFSFEHVRGDAEADVFSGTRFPVAVDEATSRVFCGSDDFLDFLREPSVDDAG